MRILLLADGMRAGGAETHVETLALGLVSLGHAVTLFSAGGAVADRMARTGIPCHTYSPVGHDPVRFLSARRLLCGLVHREPFDILHAHTRMTALLSRGICGACGQKRAKIARVVTVHARFRTSPLLRLLCDWGDRTVAVSEDLRAYVSDEYRVPAECVDVIPNGVDIGFFRPPAVNPHSRRPARVLFVSRLDDDCSVGAFLLCEVAARLAVRNDVPPFTVTVAGGGTSFAEILRVADRVNRALGRSVVSVVDPNRETSPDLPALYRGADIFVGVSRAAMEAAASGCAVILCGNEGYGGILSPDRLDLASGNFCCRGEPLPRPELLCADLRALLSDPARTDSLSSACRSWICRDFSAASMCRAVEESYRKATDGARNSVSLPQRGRWIEEKW